MMNQSKDIILSKTKDLVNTNNLTTYVNTYMVDFIQDKVQNNLKSALIYFFMLSKGLVTTQHTLKIKPSENNSISKEELIFVLKLVKANKYVYKYIDAFYNSVYFTDGINLVERKDFYPDNSGFTANYPLSERGKMSFRDFNTFMKTFLYGLPVVTESSKYQRIAGFRSQKSVAELLGVSQEAISQFASDKNKVFTLIQITENEYKFAIERNKLVNDEEFPDIKFVRVFKFKNEYLALVGSTLVTNLRYKMLSYNPKTNRTKISNFKGREKHRIKSVNEFETINTVVSLDKDNQYQIMKYLGLNRVPVGNTKRAELHTRKVYQFKAKNLQLVSTLFLLKSVTQKAIQNIEESTLIRWSQSKFDSWSINKVISMLFFTVSKHKLNNLYSIINMIKKLIDKVKIEFNEIDFSKCNFLKLVEIDVKASFILH